MKGAKILAGMLALLLAASVTACGNTVSQEPYTSADTERSGQETVEEATRKTITASDLSGSVTAGTEVYRGFLMDNVLHSENDGDIHYHIYIPESYDGSKPYALFVTLPGYEGLYFQGMGVNLESEEFAFEAKNYNDNMIIAAPQLEDWGETMSLVLEKAPELFTAYLHCSSRWDGDYAPVVENRLPVYLVIGENDEYYGSEPTREAYEALRKLYLEQGLSEEEIDRLLVLDIKDSSYFTERGIRNQHGGGGQFAFDEEIMGWLFEQIKA
ncbi:MAG: alpha/beta hydrolase [Roseburia sp.]|nr:alpha/beta hydrolase [Roseburia sp.]